MTRPWVTLSIKNELEDFMRHLDTKMPEFKSLPGVVGITLNGGLSRGFADRLSEIDLTFYLTTESYEAWQRNKSPIPLGIVKFDNVLYDIKILHFEKESERKYGHVELWDLSYAQILFDTDEKVVKLMEEKLAAGPDPSEAVGLLWESYWHYRLAGDIWVNRQDVLQGHFVLNESVKPMVKALFLVNQEYIPHEKWLIHMSYTLDWLPPNWKERLTSAMCVEDSTTVSLVNRQAAIHSLWHDIDHYLNEKWFEGFSLACHQKQFYDLVKALVDRERIPVDEWSQMASLAVLNMEPFHTITHVRGDAVILDKEALLDIKPETLYSWHYEIVEGALVNSGSR